MAKETTVTQYGGGEKYTIPTEGVVVDNAADAQDAVEKADVQTTSNNEPEQNKVEADAEEVETVTK